MSVVVQPSLTKHYSYGPREVGNLKPCVATKKTTSAIASNVQEDRTAGRVSTYLARGVHLLLVYHRVVRTHFLGPSSPGCLVWLMPQSSFLPVIFPLSLPKGKVLPRVLVFGTYDTWYRT